MCKHWFEDTGEACRARIKGIPFGSCSCSATKERCNCGLYEESKDV